MAAAEVKPRHRSALLVSDAEASSARGRGEGCRSRARSGRSAAALARVEKGRDAAQKSGRAFAVGLEAPRNLAWR